VFDELCLRGAKIALVFKSHKLFGIFFENKFSLLILQAYQDFQERLRCCGCKSSPFILFRNAFLEVFLFYFLISWSGEGYNGPFYEFAGLVAIFGFT